jgi:hypothetical protein
MAGERTNIVNGLKPTYAGGVVRRQMPIDGSGTFVFSWCRGKFAAPGRVQMPLVLRQACCRLKSGWFFAAPRLLAPFPVRPISLLLQISISPYQVYNDINISSEPYFSSMHF